MKKLLFPIICLLGWLQTSMVAKAEFEVLIAPTPESTERQFIWRVETGQWYQLEKTSNLNSNSWLLASEFMADGPVFVQSKGSDKQGFFRLRRVDRCPPQIRSSYPYDGAYSVPRQSSIRVVLNDTTGIDTNSIHLTVGALGTFTLANPELVFVSSNLVFTPQGGNVLGAYGEKINIMLQVSDVVSNTLLHIWSAELEHPDVTVSNLFVFGSPLAASMGQQLSAAQLKFAQTSGQSFSNNLPPPTWRILSIETNQVVLGIDNQQAMNSLVGVLLPGTPIANAAVSRIDQIFYRRILSVDTTPQMMTLHTEDVPLEALFTSYSFSLDDDSAVRLQADAQGNLFFPPPTMSKLSLEIFNFDPRINLVNQSWDWSDKVFFTGNPNVDLTFDRLDLSVQIYADVAGKFVLSTDSDKRALEFSASLTTAFDAGVLPVFDVDISTRQEDSGPIVNEIDLLAATPIVLWVGPVPIYFNLNFGANWDAYVEGHLNGEVTGGFTYAKTNTYWASYDYYRSPKFESGRTVSGPGLEMAPITATASGSFGAGIAVVPYLELSAGPEVKLLGAEVSAQAGVRGSLRAHADLEVERNTTAIVANTGTGTAMSVSGYELKACLTAGLGWEVEAFYNVVLDAPWPFNWADLEKDGATTLGYGELIPPLTECWYFNVVGESSPGVARGVFASTNVLSPAIASASPAGGLIGHAKFDTLELGDITIIPQVIVTNSSGAVVDKFDGGYARQWTWNGIPVPGMTNTHPTFESPSGDLAGIFKPVISGKSGIVLEGPSAQIVSLPKGAPLESTAGGVLAEVMSAGTLDADGFGAIGFWKGGEAIFLPKTGGNLGVYNRTGAFVEDIATGFPDLAQISLGTIGGSNVLVVVGKSPGGDSVKVYNSTNGIPLNTYSGLGRITGMAMGKNYLVLATTIGSSPSEITTCQVVDLGQVNPFATPLVLNRPAAGGAVTSYPGVVAIDYQYPLVLVGVPETGQTHLYNISGARLSSDRIIATDNYGDAAGVPLKMGKKVRLADKNVLIKGTGLTHRLYSIQTASLISEWTAPAGTTYYPTGIKNHLVGVSDGGDCRLYDITTSSVRGIYKIGGLTGSTALNLFSNGTQDLSVVRYQTASGQVAVRIPLLVLLEELDPESCP